jgi:UDP-N-acetylglucosamine--N-acetylmuramyl-(pentapeptide) pyrophosphoryl-undecaprenol N-acetylglucosamine transferase
MSRILIAGGGTAGHVVPALALADVLSSQSCEVAFCGTEKGMESRLVPGAGYAFSAVRIRGFTRELGLSTLRTLASLPVAGMDAWRLISRFRPACVVGVGAYASGPVVAEAALRGIPAVAVEMDSHMGWTNRILSGLVDKVCLSFPDAKRVGGKYVYTGRPLRPELLAATKEQGMARFRLSADRPVLLVFGGSLGAHTLNQACVGAFAHEVAEVLAGRDVNPAYQAFPFLDDFPLALAAADAVVSRAGGSVAEVLARGVPSLLVPYPYAAADHQTHNARTIAAQGAALVVPDADLNPAVLAREVGTLLDPEVNARMRTAALGLARPDAATRIADLVVELAAARTRQSHD